MSDVVLQQIDYQNLNKIQKLALLMIVIGPESASMLFRFFEDKDIEIICREISNFQIVDLSIQTQVMEEFSEIISASLGAILGGPVFAHRALELTKGDYKASNLLGRISPGGNSLDVIKEIGDMEAREIFNLIRYEQPQTIAFVASYLSLEKAGAVIRMLTPEMKEEVFERMGSMEETSLENVARVVQSLKTQAGSNEAQTMHKSGGVRPVADLLNMMDKETSKTLLAKLEERNPELGLAVRRKMFSFEDIIRLEPTDLQRVSREVEMSDLVVALKSANSNLQECIYNSVSKRAAETIKEEIQMLGPVRLKEVEAAQDRIIQVIRNLEDEGEITIDQGGGDRVVV